MNTLLPTGYDAVLAQTVRVKYNDNGGGAAGTYTGSVDLPGDAILIDIIVHAKAAWDSGTSATMIVGDAADDNGYYAAVDLKATDLLVTESLSFAEEGGKGGADFVGTLTHIGRRNIAGPRTVTMKIVTVGTTTAGETWMTVVYAVSAGGTYKTGTFVAT